MAGNWSKVLTKRLVARAVHHLRKSIVGKTLSVVKAQDDANVFGKVGTSGAEFQKALTGKKVISAGQQGKYFWYCAFPFTLIFGLKK